MSNDTQATPSAKTLPFFSLAAEYVIAPTAKPAALAGDAGCILEASRAAVQTVIDGISDGQSQMASNPQDVIALLFGVLYQIEMVKNMVDAIQSLEVRS